MNYPRARGTNNYLINLKTPPLETNEVLAACVNDTIFKIKGGYYDLRSVTCKEWPEAIEKSVMDSQRSAHIKVGHKIRSGWVEGYEVLFNSQSLTTRYTKFILTSYAIHYDAKVPKIEFQQGNFYE